MLQRLEGGGQHQIIHIIGNKGVVGGADTKLHGQIQTGWGFAATRNTKQDHLGLIKVAQRNTVVVGEGVVNGGNARVVLVEVTGIQTVRAMGDRCRVELHLVL